MPSAKKTAFVLLFIIICLVILSTIGQISRYQFGHGRLFGFVPLFYLGFERNFPTWYSSFTLFLSSSLMGIIAIAKYNASDAFRRHWAFLAGMLFLLSIDEMAELHERFTEPLREAFDLGGVFYYTWVIPGAIMVMAIGLIYLKFLFHLPSKTRNLFILAAVVFVGGAIGFEVLGAIQADSSGEDNLTYAIINTFEEICEMLGVVVLIYALLLYLEDFVERIEIQIGGR